MKNRIARSKSDIEAELREQLELLQMHCETYDSGKESVAKHIAVILRVLLHHHGNSRSLLEQLGLRAGYYKDSAGSVDPRNLAPTHNLVSLNCQDGKWSYVPSSTPAIRSVLFSDWWNNAVVKDSKKKEFSRRDIVTHVSNTDGGAHVDPDLEESYMDLSRNNSLGWTTKASDGADVPLTGRPELACIRKIASEVLTTLRAKAPKYFVANA